MSGLPIERFFGALADALVETQEELDERGRDSIDAFGDTGVPPTVYTLASVRVRCPVNMTLRPKRAAGERTQTAVAPDGAGTLTLSFAYHASPQGDDDPQPAA